MIIPWLFLGIVSYCVVKFNKYLFYFNPLEITNWLLGNGTYLWFLSVLLICEIIFLIIPLNNRISSSYFFIILTIISVSLTSYGILPISIDIKSFAFTSYNVYLNIFNWIGMFAFGLILRENNTLYKFIFQSKARLILTAAVCIIIFFTISILFQGELLQKSSGYWVPYSLITELVSFIFYYLLAWQLKNWSQLISVGKVTLPIFILHAPVVGILNKVFSTSVVFTTIRPLLVVIILFIILQTGLIIANKLKFESIYCTITGIKDRSLHTFSWWSQSQR